MNLALITITDEGVGVAERIAGRIKGEWCSAVTLFLPQKIKKTGLDATYFSKNLGDQVGKEGGQVFQYHKKKGVRSFNITIRYKEKLRPLSVLTIY